MLEVSRYRAHAALALRAGPPWNCFSRRPRFFQKNYVQTMSEIG